jgi:putative ABC transport system permease protein
MRRSRRDFEDEIRSHLELETDRLIAEGMDPSEAALAARRKFGNVARAQERYHEAGMWVWVEQVLLDVRHAARMLRKSPLFSAIAIVTLALGIGANTAVFSVVDAVLLRSLPYREPERLVKTWESLPGAPQIMVSYPDYKDWRERTRVFDDIALYGPFGSMTLTGGEFPVRVSAGRATANLFPLLGVAPVVGRGLRAEDDHDGAERVVLLTSGYWKRQYASDPGVVDRSLSLDRQPYRIVGVLPQTPGLGGVDVWVPVGLFEKTDGFTRGNHPGLIGVGRLKHGVTLAQMNADLARVSREIVAENPVSASGISAGGDSFRELLMQSIRPALEMLIWAVLCVLLIACANVANLLLARSTARRREMALRVAIGASGTRLVRLLLTESVLLATLGGVLGIALARLGVQAIMAMRPASLPRSADIGIDVPVLAFAAAVSVLTGLVFGLVPAWHARGVDLNDSLKESGRGASASGAALRVRGVLMATEVALALMLLIGAGLLVRSFSHLLRVDPGVDVHGVVIGSVNLPPSGYKDEDAQRSALDEILRRAKAVPGVTSAALTSAVALSANTQYKLTFDGHPRPLGQEPLVNIQMISPDYFATMRIRMVRGRGPATTDVKGAPPVVWIDETIARKYFPNENPVGKRIVHGPFDSKEPQLLVAGVVGDVRDSNLGERASGIVYMPFDQAPEGSMTLAVKTALPFEQIVPALRRQVAAFDKNLALANEQTLESVIDASIGQQKFTMFVLGVFAVVALVLAAVGVYGVIAYFVAQRAHEIGIRMALGAQRTDIVALVSRRVLVTTGIGIAVGLSAAMAASGLMTKLLYEVTPMDAATYAGGSVALLIVALAAAIVPTVRATRVNPATTMRAD